MIESCAWLRLSGYQDAADNADPLTIDIYNTRGAVLFGDGVGAG
jgi:hypothetical protein